MEPEAKGGHTGKEEMRGNGAGARGMEGGLVCERVGEGKTPERKE